MRERLQRGADLPELDRADHRAGEVWRAELRLTQPAFLSEGPQALADANRKVIERRRPPGAVLRCGRARSGLASRHAGSIGSRSAEEGFERPRELFILCERENDVL